MKGDILRLTRFIDQGVRYTSEIGEFCGCYSEFLG